MARCWSLALALRKSSGGVRAAGWVPRSSALQYRKICWTQKLATRVRKRSCRSDEAARKGRAPVSAQVWIAAVIGIAAVIEDVACRRISNWIPLSAFGAGLVLQCLRFGWRGAMSALLGT